MDVPDAERLAFWEHVGILRMGILWCAAFLIIAAIAIFSHGSDTLIAMLLKPAPGGLVFLSPLGPSSSK